MLKSTWCLCLFLLFPSASVLAQFQQPSPDELKMTADPAYPDAAAVYLNYDDKTDADLHVISRYVRIKILKEPARDLATVNLGYLKGFSSIAAVSGRTMHPDGTIVPLDVKPEDLMRVKQGQTEVHEAVFNLPSVEVGSILEYYYQVRLNEHSCPVPDWEIQQRYPVRKASYVFTPCKGIIDNTPGLGGYGVMDHHGQMLSDLLWYTNLPNNKSIAPTAAHRFELTLTDIPPLPNEQWMPPIDSQRYQVRFYFAPGTSATAYWNSEIHYWLKDVDHFAEPTAALKRAVSGIIAPADPELDKAKKLYAAVQALDNTNFTRVKSEAELKKEGFKPAKRAEDTWNQKSGSGDDISMLYLAMLRAAGLTAYPMKLVRRDVGVFNTNFLNFGQLNDTVVILDTGGKEIVLDPGEKMCPFGAVHWKHSGAGGVRQTAKGAEPSITPLLAYTENAITRRAELTVNPTGNVSGKLRLGLKGQEALHWRQRSLQVDEDTLKQEVRGWLQQQLPNGIETQITRFARLDDPSGELEIYASVAGVPGSSTPKRLLLPAPFFVTREDRAFIDQPNRKYPVDMQYAAQFRDGVLYHLPAGFSVESLPTESSIPRPEHAAYQVKSAGTGSSVTVVSSLSRAFTLVQPDEYTALRGFYQKVAGVDQQQIVLSASDAAKGN